MPAIATSIFLPNSPDIPGLVFRNFQGESDYPWMVSVYQACRAVDGLEEPRTVEDMANYYAHLVNCDPYRDMLMVEVDGQLIGYFRCEWRQTVEGDRVYIHFGFIRPEWRQSGLGTAALRYMEDHLRQIAATHPADGPRFFQTFAETQEKSRLALLEKHGYTSARCGYHMVRLLSDPILPAPLPSGVEVRPAGPEHYRAVWQADQEAFRDHWGYIAGTEEDYQRWLTEPNFQPHLWQIAWDGDQVAGMVQNFVNEKENAEHNRRRGYTEGISTRRPWRKRGLARALLTRSLQMFKDMGFNEAALGVDAQNPNGALQLYQSVGFRPVREGRTYRKPVLP